MKLGDVKEVFLSVTSNAFHFEGKCDGNYIVWAEDGQGEGEYADDTMQNQPIQGTTDYYTKDEYDPIVVQIQTAMSNAGMSWNLNSIQNEEGTGYIHYEWVWEVDNIGEDGD